MRTAWWAVGLLTGCLAGALPAAANVNAALTGAREGATPQPPRRVIVLDAGHGGRDAGCSGANSKEKHLALRLTLAVGELLEARQPDLEVVYTRDRDVFVPLHERAAIANRRAAELFVSVHCNYMPGSAATQGSETYVMGLHTAEHNLRVAKRENAAIRLEDGSAEANYDFDPDSPAGHITLSMFQHAFLERSISCAEHVERELGARPGRRSRGVKQAGFMVLKETAMPSVLVESGYLSNAREEAYLMSAAGVEATAEALYRGLVAYLREEAAEERELRPVLARLPDEAAAGLEGARDAGVRSGRPVLEALTEEVAPGTALFVQLLASKRKVNVSRARLDELGAPVRYVREGELYKYQAGPFATRAAAEQTRIRAGGLGYDGAFVVGYRDGARVAEPEW